AFVDDGLPIKDLQLQGIVAGRRGLQAIIGTVTSEQTYYCQGGERVGGFTVTSVEKDKVLLEKNGKIFELRVR
ncbi:MAG: hypothetical protein NC924_09675, partial [Candidatus Omnitrophica bacterium]|nr:hypothetical protein [Candidatus Omnitrophota bacterium]